MTTYPATFDIEPPAKFDRVQLALRLLVVIILGAFAGSLGWMHGLLWIGIPVLAAILISQKGAAQYLAEAPGSMTKWLRWIVGAFAYLGMLTDKLPNDAASPVRFDVETAGAAPTTGSALLRILLVIPHVIVLFFLGIIAFVLMILAAIMILVQESYPRSIYGFLRGYVRWQARVYAYLASLTDAYPPFALDTGGSSPAPALETGGEAPGVSG